MSLAIIPLTINYVSPTGYGIWMAISSIIGWIAYFDFGLGHGFRNRYAEAKAKDDVTLQRQLVSTTYILLTAIFGIIMIVALIANNFIDWPSLLNIESTYAGELSQVFSVLAIVFCCNFVLNTFMVLLNAEQKTASAALILAIGQFASLIGLIALPHINGNGSLLMLALVYSGLPLAVNLIVTVIAFSCTKYASVRPTISCFRKSLIKNILGLGLKFFVIMMAILILFQMINVIVLRICGPETVSEYNVCYKYFNVVYMGSAIVLAPFWSAYTEAFVKKDLPWMQRMLHKLELFGCLVAIAMIVMAICAKLVFKIWIGDSIIVTAPVLISTMLYLFAMVWSNMYTCILNGIGAIKIQMITYVTFAVIAIPLMDYLGKICGIVGILIVPTIALAMQALISRIQLKKLTAGNATGIWTE